MSKAKSKKKSKAKPKARRQPKHKGKIIEKAITASPDCPYRPGTLYGTLFTEGNKVYIAKDELIRKVAELTGKSEKVVGFAYQVLKSNSHRSNGGRSNELTEGDKVKLVAVKKTVH